MAEIQLSPVEGTVVYPINLPFFFMQPNMGLGLKSATVSQSQGAAGRMDAGGLY